MNSGDKQVTMKEGLVWRAASAALPTRYGDFTVHAFEALDGKEYAAVVKGDVANGQSVPVRVHSECLTGDVMGSYKCDCRDQLEAALTFIGKASMGAVIYLRQEGRGIGLVNKIRAYALQDQGLDTVEANLALGFEDDLREYDVAAGIIKELKISSVILLSNNPKKWQGLSACGVDVVEREPLVMPSNPHNERYLAVKRKKSGHLL